MSRSTNICLCLLALSTSAGLCAGQENHAPPASVPEGRVERTFDYIRPVPEQVIIETAGKAKIFYNENSRSKGAYVELRNVVEVPGRGIDMTVGFRYERRAAKPLWFNVEFTVDKESFGDIPGHAVAVESDGHEFDLGKAFAGEPSAKDDSRLVLKKTMLYQPFVRAFGGKNVRIRLGSFSFQLGETELAAVRDLMRLTEKR